MGHQGFLKNYSMLEAFTPDIFWQQDMQGKCEELSADLRRETDASDALEQNLAKSQAGRGVRSHAIGAIFQKFVSLNSRRKGSFPELRQPGFLFGVSGKRRRPEPWNPAEIFNAEEGWVSTLG